MSVIVKGMELPKSCFECPFMLHRSFCLVNTKIEFTDEEYSELKGRYIGCPLVEVVRTGEGLYDTYTPPDEEAAKHVTEVFRKSTERMGMEK